jgi:hypothetical protein
LWLHLKNYFWTTSAIFFPQSMRRKKTFYTFYLLLLHKTKFQKSLLLWLSKLIFWSVFLPFLIWKQLFELSRQYCFNRSWEVKKWFYIFLLHPLNSQNKNSSKQFCSYGWQSHFCQLNFHRFQLKNYFRTKLQNKFSLYPSNTQKIKPFLKCCLSATARAVSFNPFLQFLI